jgi:hypothetical protein
LRTGYSGKTMEKKTAVLAVVEQRIAAQAYAARNE